MSETHAGLTSTPLGHGAGLTSTPREYFRAADIRAGEAASGLLESGTLMRRAAHAVARAAVELLGRVYGARVAVVVGPGDNGADGLYAAAELRRRGAAVTAVLPFGHANTAALAQFRASGGVVRDTVGAVDLVIDAVFGLSGRAGLPSQIAQLFHGAAPIVAVDLPSGVAADTGEIGGGAVAATLTVTFGYRRLAHALASAQCGRIQVADIGFDIDAAPAAIGVQAADIHWPRPGPRDDKYSQGVVAVVAGSGHYPGAAVLCTDGAVRATSGLVRYSGTGGAAVLARHPEVIISDSVAATGRAQAWVVGPGVGTDDAGRERVAAVLARDEPVLLDADGLTLAGADGIRRRDGITIITPHDREFERLAGHPVGADRIAAARELATAVGATVLLKGHTTVVTDASGPAVLIPSATSYAATPGTGDVLAGIAGALLATGVTPVQAASWGAYVHGEAAARAAGISPTSLGAPITASLLAAALPAVIADLGQ